MSRNTKIRDTNLGIYNMTSPSGKVYIGSSKNLKKRKSCYKLIKYVKSQRKLYNSLMKYGFEAHNFQVVEFLDNTATEEDLIYFETCILNQYKDMGFEVLNLKEPGAKGKLSQETIEKLRKSSTGNTYAKGSKRTEEWKENRSFIMLGKKRPKEVMEKIRISNLKPILQLDLNGNFIKEWIGIKEAAKQLNIGRQCIGACCKNKLHTYKNYRWKFKSDKSEIKPIIKKINGIKIPILQYDLQYNFIKEWESLSKAAKELKLNISCISHCCSKTAKTTGNFIWKYKN